MALGSIIRRLIGGATRTRRRPVRRRRSPKAQLASGAFRTLRRKL